LPLRKVAPALSFDLGEMTNVRVASHEDLFVQNDSERCDACGGAVTAPDDTADESHGPPGRGLYLWARGEEVRFESVPLCPSCASAIGMTALARWEIEEEEG